MYSSSVRLILINRKEKNKNVTIKQFKCSTNNSPIPVWAEVGEHSEEDSNSLNWLCRKQLKVRCSELNKHDGG